MREMVARDGRRENERLSKGEGKKVCQYLDPLKKTKY